MQAQRAHTRPKGSTVLPDKLAIATLVLALSVVTGVPGSASVQSVGYDQPTHSVGSARALSASFNFSSITVGRRTVCGLQSDGTAFCWGDYTANALGTGTHGTFPSPVLGGHQFVSISPGYYHTCGVTTVGLAYCWGTGSYGRLGQGSTSTSSTPVQVVGLTGVEQVSPGYYHTCARNSTGYVFCWGQDSNGALGNGPASTADVLVPEMVPGITGAVSISAGYKNTCAAVSNGTLYCWGYGYAAKTGLGSIADVDSPREVVGIPAVREVETGYSFTCAVTTADDLYCWGQGDYGDLGMGSTASKYTPQQVTSLSNVAHVITAGCTCALLHNGSKYCWGKNDYAQPGLGYAGATETSPMQLPGTALALGVGTSYGCSLSTSHVTECWGYASNGVLGRGRLSDPIPGLVDSLTDVANISAGRSHMCALTRAAGDVYCWGLNSFSQLGFVTGSPMNPVALDSSASACDGHASCCGRGGWLPTHMRVDCGRSCLLLGLWKLRCVGVWRHSKQAYPSADS